MLKRVSSGASAIALYTYFCENAKEIYGDDVDEMMSAWMRIVSGLLSQERAAQAGGGLRFVTSPNPPEISKYERVEEITESTIEGSKIYAIWDERSEMFHKGALGISAGDATPLLEGEDERSLATEMSDSIAVVLFNAQTQQRFMINIEPTG